MSVLSYFGGKSSSAFQNFINPNIPKSGIETYLEPFSGSFATYMDDESLNFKNVIYNDKNRHQVNLMKCCSNPERMLDSINKMLNGILKTDKTDPIEKWNFYKSIYREYTRNNFLDDNDFEICDFDRAAIYAFLITSMKEVNVIDVVVRVE